MKNKKRINFSIYNIIKLLQSKFIELTNFQLSLNYNFVYKDLLGNFLLNRGTICH